MIATLLLAIYLIGGAAVIRFMLPGQRPLVRIWMGLCLGLLLFMWLPALCAFWLNFTLLAHYVSLIPLVLIVLIAFLLRDKMRPRRRWDAADTRLLFPLAILLVLFGALSLYLQWTHSLRPEADGSLHVGQSTYGDLAMHVSFITSFVGAKFPPTYAMMKGELISYPFLMDSLSASLYLDGYSLQAALIVPGMLMMLLLYMGYFLLAVRFCGSGKVAVLAFLLVFLNGGLGFLYTLDLSGGSLLERLSEIMTGFYKTPTNYPDPYNLRWSNLICDLLIPQRTLLAGYTLLLPCLYLLFSNDRKPRTMALLGLWAGALPMVHTHSFLALGLCSLGVMVYDLLHRRKERLFPAYLLYGFLAAALAAPQLIKWTFSHSTSSENFLRLHFNWSNNVNGQLIDNYLWFYLKNIGLPFVLIIAALFEKNPRWRRVFSGAMLIFIAAELVRFQPNAYDNNKLLYVWYMLCALIAAELMLHIWQRLRGLRSRVILAGFTAIVLFLSSGLTIAREVVSDYEAFSAEDVKVAEFVKANTQKDDAFLTGTQHLNPVLVLAGRSIPVSTASWLFFHGYDTTERNRDVRRFFEDPAQNADVLTKYGIRYIYLSSWERKDYQVDEDALSALYNLVYDENNYRIYAVPEVAG